MRYNKIASVLCGDGYPFDALLDWEEDPVIRARQVYAIDRPDELDKDAILVVWGGADIHPSLYKKGRSHYSEAATAPTKRDILEWECMQLAVKQGNPIIGVCRGAQMLCALAGGHLIQHIEGHGWNEHEVTTKDGRRLYTNSIHHQMMYPFDVEHDLVAWTSQPLSDVYMDEDVNRKDITKEPELVVFPQLKGVAVQWHPEGMHIATPATQLVFDAVKPFLK